MEENVISMQEIFTFQKKGIGPNGKVLGVFKPSGIRPRFLEQLRDRGHLPAAEPVRTRHRSQLAERR